MPYQEPLWLLTLLNRSIYSLCQERDFGPIEWKYLFIMSGEEFCDTRLFLGHLREYTFVRFVFPAKKAVDAVRYFFGIGKVFSKIFVKIHLFSNSHEGQHFVPIEFVGGGTCRPNNKDHFFKHFNRFPDPLYLPGF